METIKYAIQVLSKKKWQDHEIHKKRDYFASFDEAKKEAVKITKGGMRGISNIRIQEIVGIY